MKILKNIFKGFACLIIIIAIFLGCTSAYQLIMNHVDNKALPVYGQKIETENGDMNVVVMGDKEETIVLLPGYGTPSPYLDFKPLAETLSSDYRVIIAEPFGYGLSGETEAPRTVENMNKELHQCLETLGVDRYILAGHSIAGIYGLHYANTYPEEVIGYLGLDTTVACQIDGPDIPGWLYPALKHSGLYRFLSTFFPSALNLDILNEEENAQRRDIMLHVIANASMQDEGKRFKENLAAIQDMYFPQNIPVLFLLSDKSTNLHDYWISQHTKLSSAVTKGETRVLEGGHYIHYNNEEQITNIVKQFFGENNEKNK